MVNRNWSQQFNLSKTGTGSRRPGVPQSYPDEWLELRWIRPGQASLILLLGDTNYPLILHVTSSLHTHTHTHTYTYIHTHTRSDMHAYMHDHACIHPYVHDIHAYIHTYSVPIMSTCVMCCGHTCIHTDECSPERWYCGWGGFNDLRPERTPKGWKMRCLTQWHFRKQSTATMYIDDHLSSTENI